MTHLAFNTDVLAISIIVITLFSTHMYFKIKSMRKIINAYKLQADYERKEKTKLETKLQQLKWQNEILKEAK